MKTTSLNAQKQPLFNTTRTFKKSLPILMGVLMLLALAETLIPKQTYSLIFLKNWLMDPLIGAALGSISRGIPSHSLGRGMGEFRWVELLDLLKHVKKIRTPKRLILISTASRRHGVTSALL